MFITFEPTQNSKGKLTISFVYASMREYTGHKAKTSINKMNLSLLHPHYSDQIWCTPTNQLVQESQCIWYTETNDLELKTIKI